MRKKHKRRWVMSSEAAAPGHPDKACDQIADLVLDFFIERDPEARVACEVMLSDKLLAICGEFRADKIAVEEARVLLPFRIKELLAKLYPTPEKGFDWGGAKKILELKAQSADISRGIDAGPRKSIGAGDQGVLFGYACDETDELMPMPIVMANGLMKRQHDVFLAGREGLGSDAKALVSIRYEGDTPIEVVTAMVSTQHDASVPRTRVEEMVREEIIMKVIPVHLRAKNMDVIVNPAGLFVTGGPLGDTGVTGRKTDADTYGGAAATGGGGMSGKDSSKIDRTGAYMARALAKGVVEAGMSSKALVQLSYAIGYTDPIGLMVDFMGRGLTSLSEEVTEKIMRARFDLSPDGMIKYLGLAGERFSRTSVFGHFGRPEEHFGWEETDASSKIETF